MTRSNKNFPRLNIDSKSAAYEIFDNVKYYLKRCIFLSRYKNSTRLFKKRKEETSKKRPRAFYWSHIYLNADHSTGDVATR
jgi:hypothetical protein